MVDELLADAKFKKYNKRKYVQIIQEKGKEVKGHTSSRPTSKKKKVA